MSNPLVSIILPIYQSNIKYLKEAIDSVYEQKYSPIELIISSDDQEMSSDVISVLSIYDQKLNLRCLENNEEKGIFGNLNNALKVTRGEFIQILSQDDIFYNDFIADQVKGFGIDDEIGMVFSAYLDINEQGKLKKRGITHSFQPGKDVLISVDEAPEYFLKYGCLPGNISPVMIKKKVLMNVGYFNPGLKYAGDFEFWVRISSKYKMYYRDKIGLLIRNHPARASHFISNHQLLKDLVTVYSRILERIPENKRRKARIQINKITGASFVHHTIKNILMLEWPVSSLWTRYKDLQQKPFNAIASTYFYISSFPARIIRRLRSLSGEDII